MLIVFLMALLGADECSHRQFAHDCLLELMPAVLDYLTEYSQLTQDAEVKHQIAWIIGEYRERVAIKFAKSIWLYPMLDMGIGITHEMNLYNNLMGNHNDCPFYTSYRDACERYLFDQMCAGMTPTEAEWFLLYTWCTEICWYIKHKLQLQNFGKAITDYPKIKPSALRLLIN